MRSHAGGFARALAFDAYRRAEHRRRQKTKNDPFDLDGLGKTKTQFLPQ
jgi:hypothetical protein